MKRGVFMLILDFVDERECVKNNKRIFKKKRSIEKDRGFKRYSINVNGKNVIVLELTEKDLKKEDVLTLLKIYKDRVLIPEKYKGIEMLKEYIYDPKEYYQRALLSSFVNQIKCVNKEWKCVSIKISDFKPFKEFYEIVRLSKMVTILTPTNTYTEKFLNDCYYEYGAVVTIGKENLIKSGVYLDLDKIDNNGRLMINVKGKDFLLYPDIRYFEKYPEYQKLLSYNIEHNVVCAVFSDK